MSRLVGTPNPEVIQTEALRLATTPGPRPIGIRDAYSVFKEMDQIRDRKEGEPLRDYTTEITPWCGDRADTIYKIEMEGREESEQRLAQLGETPDAKRTASSMLVRHLLVKYSRNRKDKKFNDFMEMYDVAETLAPLPSYYTSYPEAASPPLASDGTMALRFLEAVKRVLLILRCLYKGFTVYFYFTSWAIRPLTGPPPSLRRASWPYP